jgi:predicted phage tail protein
MADITNQPSIGDLFADLSRDTATLIRQQMELARVELSDRMSKVANSLGKVVLGAGLAAGGLLSLVAGLVLLVAALGVPAWISALIVGGTLALIGWAVARPALAFIGRGVTPTETVQTLKESAEWVKHPTKT